MSDSDTAAQNQSAENTSSASVSSQTLTEDVASSVVSEQTPTENVASAVATETTAESMISDQTVSPTKNISGKKSVLKMLLSSVMLLFILFTFCAYFIASSYKEDTTKIPSALINLLVKEQPTPDTTSSNTAVTTVETTESPLDLSSTVKNKDTSLLEPNDFTQLNRKLTRFSALNIIDPLPVLTMSYFGNKIPIISKEGDMPWKVYAKPFELKKADTDKTKIAVLISEAGLDERLTGKIIDAFSEYVSVSFSPYSENIGEQIKKARSSGKETYLNIPVDTNVGDPGPYGIMEEYNADENFSRFSKAVGQNIAISGLLNMAGTKSSLPGTRIHKLISIVNQHGLMYIGSEKPLDNEIVVNPDMTIFTNLNRSNIRKELDSFLKVALKQKHGLLVVDSKPSALTEVINFMDNLSLRNDIIFVPVSVLIEKEKKENGK